jgi:hypothetical protein
MGLVARETFVPQRYAWGQEAQVDWYEAWADLGGERVKVQVFAMRAMASGAAFHRAYPHATQQAFLDAHERAFAYFGGVFRLLRYDNCSRRQQVLDLEHYLDVLDRKPGALAGSTPLAQRRESGSLAGLLRRTLGATTRPARPTEPHPRDGGRGGARARVRPRPAARGGGVGRGAGRLRRRRDALAADRGGAAQGAA